MPQVTPTVARHVNVIFVVLDSPLQYTGEKYVGFARILHPPAGAFEAANAAFGAAPCKPELRLGGAVQVANNRVACCCSHQIRLEKNLVTDAQRVL